VLCDLGHSVAAWYAYAQFPPQLHACPVRIGRGK
jgi:hypothetical protein